MKIDYEVVIIGAGAAGLFCALNCAVLGKKVLVVDHANKVGKKILMSGGGRCNFTNLYTTPDDFSSKNPHFCKSALKQYTPYDFLTLIDKHQIEYVEKSPGQLFCKNSSKDVLKMLLDECAQSGVKIYKKCNIGHITNNNNKYIIDTSIAKFETESLVIATGGLSIPTLGATGLGYEIAQQFGHDLEETRASLVPFMFEEKLLNKTKHLSGVSIKASISHNANTSIVITDDILFTHRGLSGPAVLKISEYWVKGDSIKINLLPEIDVVTYLNKEKQKHPDLLVSSSLAKHMPKKLAQFICGESEGSIKNKLLNKNKIEEINRRIADWNIYPSDTEGYKTAEVTMGGVSTQNISSKTMESSLVKGLYFIGEVLDVTGQLGGYNFQWAWSSAWCAAQSIIKIKN